MSTPSKSKGGGSSRSSQDTTQGTNARAHAVYLRAQRAAILAHPHGTDKSRRGTRVRVNPIITRREAKAGVVRGGRSR